MANNFSDELSKAGGDVVKGVAQTAVIGIGIFTAASLALYFGAKYVRNKKSLSQAKAISGNKHNVVTEQQEEEWL